MALIIFLALIGFALAQGIYVFLFRYGLHRQSNQFEDFTVHYPKAAIILCLRGQDPFLVDCIRALLNQDYPNYVLHIIVDHANDPAWSIVNKTVGESDNVELHTLNTQLNSCSLKCNSLIQVVSSLDSSYEFIALADADTIPDSDWLFVLATELQAENVGAVTGIRWYQPVDLATGSFVRFVWNAAAIVQMYLYGIAWGGTLAIKTEVIEKLGLLEKWSTAFCEDTMLAPLLSKNGMRVSVSPQLFSVNRESSSLDGCFRFMVRQLLTVRLHHPGWLLVLGHGLLLGITNIAAIFLGAIKFVQGDIKALILVLVGLAIFHIANVFLIFVIKNCADEHLSPDHQRAFTQQQKYMLYLSIPVALFLQFAAVVKAMVIKTVDWRGITYEITGSGPSSKIKLQQYAPLQQTGDTSDSLQSL